MIDAMPRPPNGVGEWVLDLDFDGVLHHEDCCWRRKGPFIKARSLRPTPYSVFQHVGLLEEILAPYPQVRIVLSTSWVRSYGCSGAAKRLTSESLRARVIGATFHSGMDGHAFLALPRGLQIWRDAERRKPADWIAVDDDHQNWPTSALDHYVRTHAADGISDPQVRLELENKLALMCSKKAGIRL